jgi:hypothetical protein
VTIETPLGAAPVPEFNPALDEIVNEIAELRALRRWLRG